MSGARRSGRAGHGGQRSYPRVARVNEALREVIAEELELLDDDRLQMVTVTGVAADPDLRHATVWFSALLRQVEPAATANVLAEHRVRLQAAVARQLRLKRTPELQFKPDPAITEGLKIDDLIRHLPPPAPDDVTDDDTEDDDADPGDQG